MQWLIDLGGIGPVKAKELINVGITKRNIHTKLHLLPKYTQIILKYKPSKIKYEETTKIVSSFVKNNKVIITGSWRRKKPILNDIDILVSNKNKFLKHLLTLGSKWIILTNGDKKMSGIYLHKFKSVKIDIWFVNNRDELPFMLLYSTGSKLWNIIMRNRAKKFNMKLTQYGLTNCNKKIKTEKDIFTALKMTYKTPEQRSI